MEAGSQKFKIFLVSLIFILLAVFLIGLFWLSGNPVHSVGYTLAFTAGLSMIVLPCTLPLAFVIVPLSIGQKYKKGLLMAIFFGLGLAITLTIYGVVVALMGQIFNVKSISLYMYIVAGVFAFIFGLSELGLLKISLPSYKGAYPRFIQEQGDYLRAFFLGLFLGNAGIGCPNPATYVILTYIAATGNVLYGAGLQFVNALGRFIPLLMLAILGIVGVNATTWLVKKKETIQKATGWGLVFFGAFIIVWGIYGHIFFLNTPIHEGWTKVFGKFSKGVSEYNCCIEPPCQSCLTDGMFPNNSCQCRFHMDEGHLDQVCDECKKGLANGMGVRAMARKTQVPAFTLLGVLIVGPVGWYWIKNKNKEEKKDE